jgi:lipoprotein NlpI
LEKRRKDSDAVQALKQAIALDPDYAEPYFILGKILQRRHDFVAAQKAFDAFKKLKNGDKIRDLSE